MDINKLRERSQGHIEVWQCTVDEFIEKVMPVLKEHMTKNKLKPKVVKLAASFLRIKFDKAELKGTIEYEVATAIEESLIYHVNCLGEEV